MDQQNRLTENNEGRAKHVFLATVLEYWELFLLCLGAILLIFSFGVRICTVDGPSMLPTLKDGQNLLVSNLFYEPAQGDIVIFHQISNVYNDHNGPFVKRVIATEGQNVYIDFTDGIVRVGGVTLDEEYIQLVDAFGREIGEYKLHAEHHTSLISAEDGTKHLVFEATVPQGHLFVMGDNRNNSSDSRSVDVGFVDERRVIGRAVLRLTPFSAFGTID